MSARDPFTKSKLFQQALSAVLRPLTRALIAQGVTAPALYKIVKQSYVDVAVEELQDKATDSRVSVMTGIHRRDVKAFRDRDADDSEGLRKKVSTMANVVGRWISDPDLQQENGAPLPLARSSVSGQPNFDDLVTRISRDIRSRTVLDEMARQGIVRIEDGLVHLEPGAIYGSEDQDRKLHYFAQNMGDHMEASVGNLLGDKAPSFERAAFFNYLKAQSVDEIEELAREIGMAALREVGAKGTGYQDADKAHADATHRFRFGIYFYREDEGPLDHAERPEDDQNER